jgi:acyl-CoA thioester hydrolase
MTRLDRSQLAGGHFPFQCEIPTRYADLDSLAHINNVATAEILQEARIRFLLSHKVVDMPGCTLVIAAAYIEYAAEMLYPDPVQVSVGILDIGRTSFRYGQLAQQQGRVGAYAEFVQVASNGLGPVPLPAAWRAVLAGLRITNG